MTKPTKPENLWSLDGALPGQAFDFGILGVEEDPLVPAPTELDELLSVDTSEVADIFWISITGPLALQSGALEQLKGVMRKFPEITVELGWEPRDW